MLERERAPREGAAGALRAAGVSDRRHDQCRGQARAHRAPAGQRRRVCLRAKGPRVAGTARRDRAARCWPRQRATPAACGALPPSASVQRAHRRVRPRSSTIGAIRSSRSRGAGGPLIFAAGRASPKPRSKTLPSTPCRCGPIAHLPPLGLLLLESDEPEIDDDVLWFAEVLGEKFQALRLRNVTADPGVDRERHLLYSIINSVTDPILLTDEAGKLIIGNLRAEQLFAIRAGGKRRPAPRRRDQQSVLLVGARRPAGRRIAAGGARGDPRRSGGRIGPAVRAADLAHVARARHRRRSCRCCATSPTSGRARQELEENYRRLMEAEVPMRTERNRLDLLVDSVGDPIIVTDPAGDILMTNAPAERFFTAARGRRPRTCSGASRPTSRSSRRSYRADAAERHQRHAAALARAARSSPIPKPAARCRWKRSPAR